MRNLFLFSVFVLLSGSNAVAQPQTTIVPIAIENAAVPAGLSNKDSAYVEVAGRFPNTCYRWGKAEIERVSEFVHIVRAYASYTEGTCLMVLVPYRETIQLGTLPTGDHVIKFSSEGGSFLERTLKIL